MNRLYRLFAPESLVFLATMMVTLWWFQSRAFLDPGCLWHTVVGGHILDSGFMTTDPFSYTQIGRTWIPQQWGAEVSMALAHRAGGFDLQLLLFATFVAGLTAWLTLRLRQSGMHALLAAAFASAAVVAASFHFFVRPHLVTVALTAWVAACLVDFDRGRAGMARLASLILLCVVWTNLHGGVLGGILTLGLAVLGWGLQLALDQRRGLATGPLMSWRQWLLLCGVVLSCLLTPFDSPFGLEMVRTWTRIVGSPVLKDIVTEHQPLNLTHGPDQVVAGFGLAFLILLAGALPNWRTSFRVTWLLPLVWLMLTVQGIRQGPLFAVVAAVVAADIWPRTIWNRLLKKYGDCLAYGDPDARWRLATWILPVLLFCGVLAMQQAGVRVRIVGAGWAAFETRCVPVDLTAAIQQELATTPNARIFNDCNLGGYQIYFHPDYPVYMDDRFELYGDDWTRDYFRLLTKEPDRIEIESDRYGCTHAFVEVDAKPTALAKYLAESSRWELVAKGKAAAFYRRLPATTP